ncbi:aminoacyl-tRNA deacylase [Sphingobium bisphenolivorans]|uniref:aminoacyl-tRNA deacylase n=1 Tax=Sphingobium bisphenolivorans TaxID=1335760 RepID=UPI00039C9671|nr:YbaK/EbsC family protein [Sphingobium bisphenolivorans]
MSISPKLRGYMDRCGTRFDEVMHEPAVEMGRVAQAAHVPGRQVAKAVLVQAGDEYILTVLPSSKHVSFDFLRQWLARDVNLVEEHTTAALFPDCELGAIPPVGAAYGLRTILDDDMMTDSDIYFEGGDHSTLIHVTGADWKRLQKGSRHFSFSI